MDFFTLRGVGKNVEKGMFFGAFCAVLPFFAAKLPDIFHTLDGWGGLGGLEKIYTFYFIIEEGIGIKKLEVEGKRRCLSKKKITSPRIPR